MALYSVSAYKEGENMKKVIHNNLIIDLCRDSRYLKYLPQQQRFVEAKPYCANAFLGSDKNTVYHLYGTPYNFDNQIKTVLVQDVDEKEFERLNSQLILQNSEQNDLRKEMNELKETVARQNKLIEELLKRL